MYRWILALSIASTSAQAQSTTGTIDPGMSKAQVIERLGKPATIRSYETMTYLLYSNACARTCGMQDLVVLDHDAVVDAIFRSPNRHYSGTSSSPVATRPDAKSARSGTLQVRSPVPPSTTPAPIAPAPASTTNTPVDPQASPPSEIPHKGAVPAKADSAMAPFQGSRMSPEDSALRSGPPNTPPSVNTTTPPRT